MKKLRWQNAVLLFEQFRKHSISAEDLDRANEKASHLDDRMDDFKLLICMCRDSMSGRYNISKWNLSVLVGTIIYVLSPLDAVPDIVPILGWIDDVSIVGYAISKLAEEMRNYRYYRDNAQLSDTI